MDNAIPLKTSTSGLRKTNPTLAIIGKVLIYVVLIVGAIIALFPFFWMVSTSLMTLGETLQLRLLPAAPQWANKGEEFERANLENYLVNILLITLETLAVLLITSILAA